MILRFASGAGDAERRAVLHELGKMEVPAEDAGDSLRLGAELDPEEALRLAAMPGVASIAAAPTATVTVRDTILDWIASATAVLGVLVVIAANFPPPLGGPADPLHTPATVRPAWPHLPIYAAEDLLPAWIPVSVVALTAGAIVLFWPLLGRRLAERAPRAHAALGVAVLASLVALAVVGVRR